MKTVTITQCLHVSNSASLRYFPSTHSYKNASSHHPCRMKLVLELSQRLTPRMIPSLCSIHNPGINES